ncbi:MAG: site-specific DNA-methyltransferase [Candidimonas sp.]
MKTLPPESFDLVITSPPYNAGKEYEKSLQIDEYEKWSSEWIREILKLLKPNGAFWLNVGYTKISETETLPLTYLFYPLAINAGFHLIQEIVWHYEGGMSYKRRFTHRTERWMWFVRNPKDYTFNLDTIRDPSLNKTQDKRNNHLGKNPTDYWYFNRVVGGNGKTSEKSSHPCQFPEKMIERIILGCSNSGDRILDPFGGSGTTATVGTTLGRQCTYIEKDIKYFTEAERRIKNSSITNNDDVFDL